ncbi:MAG: HD domain-containing phosphohydrolase [Gemmatimonadota bacterium]
MALSGRSRVARRITLLFVICALLPIGVLSFVSYRQVSAQLHEQSRERLRQTGKSTASTVYGRLQLLEAALQTAVNDLRDVPGQLRTRQRFRSLSIQQGDQNVSVFGSAPQLPRPNAVQREHLRSGRAWLVIGKSGGEPGIFLAAALDRPDLTGGILWAEINPGYLWSDDSMAGTGLEESSLPATIEVCVFELPVPVYCSPDTPPYAILSRLDRHLKSEGIRPDPGDPPSGDLEIEPAESRDFSWSEEGTPRLAAYWPLYLSGVYAAPPWTFVVSEREARALLPLAGLRRILPLAVVLALLVVLLLSDYQVRRSLGPLNILKQGTARVAKGEFAELVEVRSGDEFEELANSFNEMASELAAQFETHAHLVNELHDMNWGTLAALAHAIDAKSAWTAGHAERVTELALSLAQELDLPPADHERLHRGGLLHDIGKIGIPGAVLNKPGKLTKKETTTIRTHPELGAHILGPIAAFADLIPIVKHHHEQFDGSGYPDGLAGSDIPFLARVLAVADVYDSLRIDRPYRAGLSHARTLKFITDGSGTHFDPRVVDALLAVGHTIANDTEPTAAAS